MFQLAVCDDREQDLDEVTQIISEQGPFYAIHSFTKGSELLSAHAHTPFDLVVLDIVLGEDNGIDLAAQLQATHPEVQNIFISSSNSFMYESYRVPHLWYINKDDVAALLPKALLRAKETLEKQDTSRLMLRVGGSLRVIPCRDVLYLEQLSRKTYIHTVGEVLSQYGKLSDCAQSCPYPAFVQCHKSFVVNMDAVQTVARDHLLLLDGTSLPISRSCLANIQNYLIAEVEQQDVSAEEEPVL